MGIKGYFIDNKIKRTLAENLKNKNERVLVVMNKLAIFVDEESSFNKIEFKNLKDSIKLNSTHFNILTYKENEESHNEFQGPIVTKKDFNWLAALKSDTVREFIESHYDILIDYTATDSPIKKLIVAQINASFKVGCLDDNNELYDLRIKVDSKEIAVFNKELVRYLKILNLIKK